MSAGSLVNLENLKYFDRIWRRLSARYYFGFARGHQELSFEQIASIKEILVHGRGDEAVGQYERRFTALIGQGFGKSFSAGRMAFYSLLKVLNIGPGDEVILPAFTCAVMPNAVWRCGGTPIFADIDPGTFGSDPQDIKQKISRRTKMIVAQHSFGIPCRIEEIVKIAREHSVFLLEDSALALDSSRNGVKVGNWGDAAIFSTDHTKPLNTLVGGFFYTRDQVLFGRLEDMTKEMPPLGQAHQQRLYDQFLFERRYYSPSHFGRSVFESRIRSLLKQGSIFFEGDYSRETPVGHDYPYPARLPAFLAQLGLFELERWAKEKQRRQELLREFIRLAEVSGSGGMVPAGYLDKSNEVVPLRFAFSTSQAVQMKKDLSQFLDTDQFWFQSAVICCPEGPESLGYIPGSCPNAEETAPNMINWPCVLSDHSSQTFLRSLRVIYAKR
jgi:dTDP-4-amino-4,6-dideoxygalactose transaminase